MHSPRTHRPGRATLLAAMLVLPLLTACGKQDASPDAASHMERAATYVAQGQYRSAILETRNAIQLEPASLSHRLTLVDLYMDIGAAKQAATLLEQVRGDHPHDTALPLARAYLRLRKHVSARETMAGFQPSTPEERLEADLIEGEILRQSGRPDEAEARFAPLVTAHPANPEAMEGLLKSRLDLRQNARVIDTANDWLATHPANPGILYLKGIALYRSNQLEAATESLTEAVTAIPDADVLLPVRRQVLLALSKVLTEQGRISEAQVYNQLLAENADSEVDEQVRSAITAIEENRLDDAKTILQDVLKLNPENSRIGLLLGTVEAGTGDTEESVRLLDTYLDPETSPTPFIQAATAAQVDLGQREKAYGILARALQARPNDNDLLAMHGVLALSMAEHRQEGLASLSKAIANEPERVRLRLALARYYLSQQQTQQALGQLRMAFTTNPAEWAATGLYLKLLLANHEDQEAGEIRDSLLNGYGNQPEAVILASMADLQLGEADRAQARLEQLVADHPDNDAARQALAALYTRRGLGAEAEQAYLALARQAPRSPQAAGYLQRAAQAHRLVAPDTPVRDWLGELGRSHPELRDSTDALRILASVRQGQLESARRELSEHMGNESPLYRHVEGQLLMAESQQAGRDRNWQTALAKAAEARALAPDNRTYALLEVQLLGQQGRIPEALSALDALESTLGRQPDTLLARGTWLLQSGEEDAAAQQYQAVLEQAPDHVVALNNLAWILRERNAERALELAGRAAELAPDNADVLDTYAWILHLSGDHAQADHIIERAFALAPDNDQIKSHRSRIKQQL